MDLSTPIKGIVIDVRLIPSQIGGNLSQYIDHRFKDSYLCIQQPTDSH